MSQSAAPILSIVIPTKDRPECLVVVVDAILELIPTTDYEIVVQDNSTDGSILAAYVDRKKDTRIKYEYHAGHLSVSDNSARAVANARGKYLVFIGDDDIVSPYVCEIAHLLDKQDIEALIYKPGNYYWSDVHVSNENYYFRPGVMQIPQQVSMQLQPLVPEEQLQHTLGRGTLYIGNLPRIYHGMVKKELMDRIMRHTGSYFPGASPDMASSIALACVAEKNYYYANYPVTVTGVSKKSAAGMGIRNAHVGKLEDQKFLPPATLANWNIFVPRIWTGPTIYAQSALEALQQFGKTGLSLNYNELYAYLLTYIPEVNTHTFKAMAAYRKKDPLCMWRVGAHYVKKMGGKWYAALRNSWRLDRQITVVEKMDTIYDCMNYLKKYPIG
ncbi:glycosyltransferase family 2 protein [Chitinophaga varians]|uniref:glycosyltransferase family 2 protein n=1 Tax=Chitinophaga varians TaxID=2202339 RepID=UPI00165F2814|nr:glycosyltransferase [Chitinophaga varians]MBC9910591.1 glycosyltransferase [Chitinophaga varians]